MFDNCKTLTKQGDLGEARAIYEYTKMGYVVSKPLCDSEKYDLIVDNGESLKKVQVKTTAVKNENGTWDVFIATSGGNTKTHTRRLREDDDYDILFVMNANDECWSIPTTVITAKSYTRVGGTKYNEYKI